MARPYNELKRIFSLLKERGTSFKVLCCTFCGFTATNLYRYSPLSFCPNCSHLLGKAVDNIFPQARRV